MNIYMEARKYFKDLLEDLTAAEIEELEIPLEEADLHFLVEIDEGNTEYEYSVYNSELFEAIADDLNILGYAEEVEREYGSGIAANPLLINEAIFRYILDQYGEYTAKDFSIELE